MHFKIKILESCKMLFFSPKFYDFLRWKLRQDKHHIWLEFQFLIHIAIFWCNTSDTTLINFTLLYTLINDWINTLISVYLTHMLSYKRLYKSFVVCISAVFLCMVFPLDWKRNATNRNLISRLELLKSMEIITDLNKSGIIWFWLITASTFCRIF